MKNHWIGVDGWFDFPRLYSEVVARFDNAVFVEIGSWKGKSTIYMAEEIHHSRKNIRLYCVDTWEGAKEQRERAEIREGTLFDTFLDNIEPVKSLITPLRMTSLQGARLFGDRSLDFIFIDASHEYEDVRDDLAAWFPKLKVGGIIAGHDYANRGQPGVKQAVDEFAEQKGLSLRKSEFCWIIDMAKQ